MHLFLCWPSAESRRRRKHDHRVEKVVAYKHNPKNPNWVNRDRFVLSNGHASMLLYSLLHLTGYNLSMDDIKNFRQLHSKTPGHPEIDRTEGVDIGTGPLGQGIATAVGMALAEKLLAKEFNKENHTIVDHKTWVFLGDGCLMEGVSQEAISLAGTWKLNKLIALYDSNSISIDGNIKDWFTDDVAKRFEASGWLVIKNVDGHDPKALDKAIKKAQKLRILNITVHRPHEVQGVGPKSGCISFFLERTIKYLQK